MARQPHGAEEAELAPDPNEDELEGLGDSEVSDPELGSTEEPLIRIEEPTEEPPQSKGLLFLQMIVFPLLIVGVCVSIVLLIGYLVGEDRDPAELLQEVESGWGKKQMQAAYEFQMRLAENPELREDDALAARVVQMLERPRIWNEEEVRRHLVLSLQGFESPEVVPAQVRALQSDDEDTVLYALFGMLYPTAEQEAELRAEALPGLEELLSSSASALRMTAARVLGKIGEPEHIEALRPLLHDSAPFVRVNATLAIASLGGADLVCDRLLKMVQPGWSDTLPWAAQKTAEERSQPVELAIAHLARLECDGWRPAVERLAKEGETVRIKTVAREALESR